jgi:hypothetical protein
MLFVHGKEQKMFNNDIEIANSSVFGCKSTSLDGDLVFTVAKESVTAIM